MADIAKFQGTDIANLAKLWGTNVSSLASIMGLTVSTSTPGTVTAGTPAVFESANSYYVSACKMDATHAIVCYSDLGNSNKGTACCLALSGSTITAGTPVVFESGASRDFAVCSMDSTTAIVVYRDNDNNYYGTACLLTLSGTTITAGTPAVMENADWTSNSICAMDSTHAIVCYLSGSSTGVARCLSLSGSTITAGSACTYESGSASSNSVCKLTSSAAVVCYKDSGNSSYGTCCHLTLSGTTVTAATPVVFESASTSAISVGATDSTHVVVCYTDSGNNNYGTACALAVSGSTITPGTPVVFESAETVQISVCALSSTRALVCYSDAGNSYYGTACTLAISGSTLTAGSPVVFESATIDAVLPGATVALDDAHAITTYRDGGNSSYGTACCLTIS